MDMILRVKVKPNSRIDTIEKDVDGGLLVRIKEQPIEGKANKYLIAFIGKVVGVPKTSILVAKGGTSSYKTLTIDATAELVFSKIEQYIKTKIQP